MERTSSVAKSGASKLPNTIDTPYRHFGEPTRGNAVQIFIDGQEMMAALYADLCAAEKEIYIAGLELLPLLLLRRDMPDHSDALANVLGWLGRKNPTIKIRILLFEPSQTQSLKQKSAQEVKKALEATIPQSCLQVQLDRTVTGTPFLKHVPIIGPTYSGTSGAAHQKVIVIDGKVGYCGGLDLTFGRWDTKDHSAVERTRDKDEKGGVCIPWHDVHARIVGPAVWDLQLNFLQRWFHASADDSKVIKEWELKQNKPGLYRSTKGDDGPCDVQVTRTWKQAKGIQCQCQKCDYKGKEIDAFSIKQMYLSIFGKANNFIYVENQYAFQNEEVTNALLNQLKSKPALKVIIVLPLQPDLMTQGEKAAVWAAKILPIPIILPSLWTFEGIPDLKSLNSNLKKIRDASGGRAKTFCLVANPAVSFSVDGATRERTDHGVYGVDIYVHAKICIVDDRWMTLGSANLDDWGLEASSEMNVLIDNPELAKATRVRLWREHLGLWGYEMSKSDDEEWRLWWMRKGRDIAMDQLDLANPDHNSFALELWDRLAIHNVYAIDDMLKNREHWKEPFIGHIYHYAYREMNLLPPFTDARGGGKGSS
jgi:phosphatidylserine/phosphatidylglycerophosphate/cardiolipin synthase-like enzyme